MSTTTTTTSSTMSSTVSATSTAVANAVVSNPPSYKIIGVCLAIGSGLFIGASFVIKKKGLLQSQAKSGNVAGEGHAYLKSWLWWLGMTMSTRFVRVVVEVVCSETDVVGMMFVVIIGEVFNFVAYAFTEAILVTPLGALSVVICAVLSSIFLQEKLTFFGKIGCLLSILGATIVALNGPTESSANTIPEFQKLFLAPGFLVFGSLVIVISLGLIFFVAPKYGKTHMLVYITICSLIGGLSVACTSGLGASILTSIRGDNQFKHWFIYFLLGFVIITLLTEINYLNKALELYNTAMVTPTYYVIFTGATLITSSILNQGFKAPVTDIVTVVMGFLVICCGITLLQLSKVDPVQVSENLDRKTTILLNSNRGAGETDREKTLEMEDPGMDALRGTFGAIGSIHRAVSARRSIRNRREASFDPNEIRRRHGAPGAGGSGPQQSVPMTSYQLYDAPMPNDAMDKISLHSAGASGGLPSPTPRNASRERGISFAQADNVHRYGRDPRSKASHDEVTLHPHSHEHVSTLPSTDIGTTSFFSEGQPRTSSPDRLRTNSYPTPFDLPTTNDNHDLLSPSTKTRFGIPNDGNRSRSNSNNRPAGPKDLDQAESKSLVNHMRTDSRDTESDDEDDEEGGGRGLERVDTRDTLQAFS